ncbi:MAG: DNA gyrase C-terminal beta-propeller domain-containing protein, partial [Gaiellaceae bacterium]
RKGRLAGARIVRDGYQVMLISDAGTVIKIPVDGIRRAGRSTQGVIVMRLREGEKVATLAPVIGSDDDAQGELLTDDPNVELVTDDPSGAPLADDQST